MCPKDAPTHRARFKTFFLAAAIADGSRHGKCCSCCCCCGGGGGDHFASANVQSKGVHQEAIFCLKNGCIKGEAFLKKMGAVHHKS